MTEGSAPSMPATATMHRADMISSAWDSSRWTPDTPTSYRRFTRLPSASAVTAASSATGMSLVPPVATTTVPSPSGSGGAPMTPMRPDSL